MALDKNTILVIGILTNVLEEPRRAKEFLKHWPPIENENNLDISAAWGCLDHFVNDEDLCSNDEIYKKYMLNEIKECLNNLQAKQYNVENGSEDESH